MAGGKYRKRGYNGTDGKMVNPVLAIARKSGKSIGAKNENSNCVNPVGGP